MPATTQVDKIAFGSGRMFVTAPGGLRMPYGDLTEIAVSVKVDLKEAYAEPGFPIAVADGHRSIDITANHYKLSLDTVAADLGLSAPTASTSSFALDDSGNVPASTPYTATLTQTPIAGTVVIFVNGIRYVVLTTGSAVAGVSVVQAGTTLTFASGDAGLPYRATYQYANTNGKIVTITNTYQNSSTPYQVVAVKRDIAPDGTVGQLIATFNACRAGGFDLSWKEGDFTVYKRTLKAYADTNAIVGTLQFVNTTTSVSP